MNLFQFLLYRYSKVVWFNSWTLSLILSDILYYVSASFSGIPIRDFVVYMYIGYRKCLIADLLNSQDLRIVLGRRSTSSARGFGKNRTIFFMIVNRTVRKKEQKLNSPDGGCDFSPDPSYLNSVKKLTSVRLA